MRPCTCAANASKAAVGRDFEEFVFEEEEEAAEALEAFREAPVLFLFAEEF